MIIGGSLLLGFGRGDMVAQVAWDRAVSMSLVHERVLGLLDLSELFLGRCESAAPPKSVDLHEGPSTNSLRIGWLEYATVVSPDGDGCSAARFTVHFDGGRPDEQLPTDESGYEVLSAVVYERAGAWFRIALQHGSAWMRRERADDFAPYPEILEETLPYIREGWDGRLWRVPAEGEAAAIPAPWRAILGRHVNVEVIGLRQVRSVRWVQVRIATEVCGRTYEGVTATTGWIPAYRASGEPSLWFYSRGC